VKVNYVASVSEEDAASFDPEDEGTTFLRNVGNTTHGAITQYHDYYHHRITVKALSILICYTSDDN
jgi:hypothetical protein